MPGFPKQARLLKPAAFDTAFKSDKRLSLGPLMAVVANNSEALPRIGFALAKRHAKTAVQRNRIRRALRERFRLAQPELAAVDVVITLRSNPGPNRPQEAAAVEAFWQLVLSRCQRRA